MQIKHHGFVEHLPYNLGTQTFSCVMSKGINVAIQIGSLQGVQIQYKK